jgi:DNA-binding transcriptional ArsR family regulator
MLFNHLVHNDGPDPLSATFAALADPTRRAILARLAQGESSVTELAEPFEMSLPAISKHLKVLERAGLIARGREAQWRPCRLEPDALKPVDTWLEDYRQLWNERLDRLDAYLQGLQAKERKEKKRGRKK